jgi:hypothetical protein
MEIHKNGLLIQEKQTSEKCATCRNKLMMQVYHYKGGLRRVISCNTCKTFTELKTSKKYMTDMKKIKKPDFLTDN